MSLSLVVVCVYSDISVACVTLSCSRVCVYSDISVACVTLSCSRVWQLEGYLADALLKRKVKIDTLTMNELKVHCSS